jgi:DNA-binding transcriptional ArsR family regulator
MANGRPAYREHVPAVARAIQALERLSEAQQPLALSALSRALNVGPSSLLAILKTLSAAGLVSRSARDGRYQPGAGLVALGTAAAQRLEPLHLFDSLAADLVESLGETVLLWIQHGDDLALAAAREGTHPLRYVPPLGLRLTGANWMRQTEDGIAEGELEPNVLMLAAHLDERSILAIAGPSSRIAGGSGSAARRTLAESVGGSLVHATPGPIEPTELDAFLGQALVASLSYLSSDGYPASVPLWYEWDGVAFWLVPSPGAEWAEHVRRNPRVSLSVSESTAPLRRVLARGPIVSVDDGDGTRWRSIEGHLAARYARLDAGRLLSGRSDQRRVLLRLVPERLIAWRGLLRPPGQQTLRSASEKLA